MTKSRRNKNDISIDKDKWITWIDLEDKQNEAVQIDNIILINTEIWYLLETDCVSACCGIDAFNFWPENIENALTKVDKEQVLKDLNIILEQIKNIESAVIVSTRLNNYFNKKVFIQLIEHIIECINLKKDF